MARKERVSLFCPCDSLPTMPPTGVYRNTGMPKLKLYWTICLQHVSQSILPGLSLNITELTRKHSAQKMFSSTKASHRREHICQGQSSKPGSLPSLDPVVMMFLPHVLLRFHPQVSRLHLGFCDPTLQKKR